MNKTYITTYENRKYIIFLKDDKPVKIRVLHPDNFYPDAVYVGCVRNKKENINSSFVSYGNKQFGFLKKSDIKPGTLLPVIVKKQTDGHKEDVLTDKISLSGVYVVIFEEGFNNNAGANNKYGNSKTFNNAGSDIDVINIKFSSKLTDEFKHEFLNKAAEIAGSKANNTDLSNSAFGKYSVIIRSNAANADFGSIVNEYNYLKDKLERILKYSNTRTEGTLLYHGLSECITHIASESLMEYDEILTDDKTSFDEINLFLSEYKNVGINVPVSLKWYNDTEYPLYKLISIKKLLALSTDKKVFLKSNAYITIEHTEAMTVVDVNTATTSYKGDKACVIHNVNMEAAEEIAVQLKLRNISGIIIIDFINEYNENNKQELVKHIKQLLKNDDSSARFVSLTKLGLVELTRDRKSKPLLEQLKALN